MKIKGAETIAEYKEIQKQIIQEWIDRNFVEGAVTWEMVSPSTIKVMDKTGDSMIVSLAEIN